jgi:hypothetical protein
MQRARAFYVEALARVQAAQINSTNQASEGTK